MKKTISLLIIATLLFILAACGSDETTETTESESASATETETPSETGTAEPSETEDKDELAPDGVWETDGERVTIEDDTVTIDYIDEDGNVTETYWVGSFELDEESDTWTSTRDPEAEMTCESETIEFTWSGEGENVYDKLSYAVTNEDGTTTTVTLDRMESLGDVEKGVVPNFDDSSSGDTSSTSASPSSSNTKNSDTASANESTSASASANTGNNTNNDSSGDSTSGSTTSNGNGSGNTASNTGSSGSTGSSNSGSTSSGSSSSSNGNNSSSNSGGSSNNGSNSNSSSGSSSGTNTTACSHNYQGTVTKAATCSTAGTTTYTCTKCGSTYTSAIAATGNHSWNPVYKTVHHDEVGHYETTTTYQGVLTCNACGASFYTSYGSEDTTEIRLHIKNVHNGAASWSTNVTENTTNTWVVDQSAYDETVIDYYKCSVCGATK